MSPILTHFCYKIKQKNQYGFYEEGFTVQQKIKQDEISIGSNIRRIRKERGIGQTEFAIKLQLSGLDITRETLVKIERGIQHVYATQLRAMRDILETTYDELLK